MTKTAPLGLVGAGALSRSFVIELPVLADRLGPVWAPSRRLASRLVNSLRAGYPARKYEDLKEAGTVLVAVPDNLLAEVVSGLADALADCSGRIVLLCDSRLDSAELAPLAERGAATASLMPVPGLAQRYVVEGERRAVREARHLVQDERTRVFELPVGNKAVFLAALAFTGPLLLPVADAAARCLRVAGLPTPAGDNLGEQLIQRTLRAYMHAGRKAWSVLSAGSDRGEIARHLAALEAREPSLARAYRVLAGLALEWFERDAGRLEKPSAGGPTSSYPLSR